jgi:large subunit ribosomal protein L4
MATTIPLYNVEGKEVGTLPLPDAIFGVEFNEALVHQAIVAEEANQRQGTHNTKQRSDVRGGGKKPWRQKGTGRARQGTIRAPHWRGGGIVFGPHPRDYRKAFPVKMRRGAMRSVLSVKVTEGLIIGLEALHFNEIKTKQAVALLKALSLNETRRVLIIIPEHNEILLKSTRNLPNVELRFAPNFSVRDVLVAHKIVLVADAVSKIQAVWTPPQPRFAKPADGTETTGTESSEPEEVAA